jgi:D-alanyl-D-alanine carboxypeptidase
MQRTALLFTLLLLMTAAQAQFLEIGPAGQRVPQRVESIPVPVPAPFFAPNLLRSPVGGTLDPQLAQRLQQTLDSLQAQYNPIGLSAALAMPNGSIWEGATGINSTAAGDTLHPGLLLGIGSVSKNLTAATLLQLEEEGLLSLDDSLGHWLPPYPNVNGSITLRRLLNHTSGIANYTDNPAFWQQVNSALGTPIAPTTILQNHVGAPLFAPGAGWSYSNTNYLLAGLVIEAATETSFHQAVRERLLLPQELSTVFLLPQETAPQALGHMWVDINGDGVADNFTGLGLPQTAIFSGAWAAGAYCSSAADMASWIKRLMEGDVLPSASLGAMMETVQVTPGFRYGLGLYRIEADGWSWWGHDGYLFYQALVLYQPDLGIGMALLSNDGEFEEMGPVFLALAEAYQYLVTSTAIPSPTASFAVAPNPFADEIVLAFNAAPRAGRLRLLDAQGRMVAAAPLPAGLPAGHSFRWQLPPLPAGLYFLHLHDEAQAQAVPLVKR